MVEITESNIQDDQRDILRLFREISQDRLADEENATNQCETEINEADGQIKNVIQDVEKQIEQDQKKTLELSHIYKADKWLIISLAIYVLIFINEYTIIISQIISSVGLSRAASAWNMSEKKPSTNDKLDYLWLMFLPFAPFLLALYYRLISYPKGLKSIYMRYPDAIDEREANKLLDEGEEVYETFVNINENNFIHNIDEISSTYKYLFENLTDINDTITTDFDFLAVSWEDEFWKDWEPFDEIISFIRIGDFIEKGKYDVLSMPAILPIIGGRNIMFKISESTGRSEVQAIKSIMLRMLSFVPPGKLQFVLIDPLYSHELADFLCLNRNNQNFAGSQVLTEPQDIERELSTINSRMEFINQSIIPKYSTFENYCSQSEGIVEPYKLLVVIDYPFNISDDSRRYLNNIARIGPRCGIHTIITVDMPELMKNDKYDYNLEDIEDSANEIIWDNESEIFFLNDEDFKRCHLNLDYPPSKELFNSILEKVGSQAHENDKIGVCFNEIISKYNKHFWEGSSGCEIQAPIGLTQTGDLQNFKLDNDSPHGLVIGQTGKGKTFLFHVIVNALGYIYSPKELQLYLIDLKKGVGFKPYATHRMPHARVVAINSQRKFGVSVLKSLSIEMEDRAKLFRNLNVGEYNEYRLKVQEEADNKTIPRILLLVDEFQKFFEFRDSIADNASTLLKELVTQGRGFGIHILLGSQSLAGDNNPGHDIIGQIAVRIALPCLPADSHLILAENNDAAAYLSRRGEAIYNNNKGFVNANINFQIAWLTKDKIESNLIEISNKSTEKNYIPSKPQIVFDGDALAELGNNQRLNNLIRIYPNITQLNNIPVWLGEPINVEDEPTTAFFNNNSAYNLIVSGENESTAAAILLASLIALGFQHGKNEADFSFINLGSIDAPYFKHFNRLSDFLPHPVKLVEHNDLPDFFNTVSENIMQRQNMGHQYNMKPHFIVVFGIHKLHFLKEDDLYEVKSLTERFATILKQGPNVRVHTMVWCDSYNGLKNKIGSSLLSEFNMRIALQMVEESSIQLISSNDANKLKNNEAIYYSANSGKIENFRPYGLPSVDWLEWVKEKKNNSIIIESSKLENINGIKKVNKSKEFFDQNHEDTFEPKMVCPDDGKITLGVLEIKNSTPFLYCKNCNNKIEIKTNKFIFDTNILVNRLFSDLSYKGFFNSKKILIPKTVIDEINNFKNQTDKKDIYIRAFKEIMKLRFSKDIEYKNIGKEAKLSELIEKGKPDKIIVEDARKENAILITGDKDLTIIDPDVSVIYYKYTPPSLNEEIIIEIIGESQGDGLGYYKDYTIFIKGGNDLINETVYIEIENVFPDKRHAKGKIIDLN